MSYSINRLVYDNTWDPLTGDETDLTLEGSTYSYGTYQIYVPTTNEIWVPVANVAYEPYWSAADGMYGIFDADTKIFNRYSSGETALSLEAWDTPRGMYDSVNDCIWVFDAIGITGQNYYHLAKFNTSGELLFVVKHPGYYYGNETNVHIWNSLIWVNEVTNKIYCTGAYQYTGLEEPGWGLIEINPTTGIGSSVLFVVERENSNNRVLAYFNGTFDNNGDAWFTSEQYQLYPYQTVLKTSLYHANKTNGVLTEVLFDTITPDNHYYIPWASFNTIDNTCLVTKQITSSSREYYIIDCPNKTIAQTIEEPFYTYWYALFVFDSSRNCYWTWMVDHYKEGYKDTYLKVVSLDSTLKMSGKEIYLDIGKYSVPFESEEWNIYGNLYELSFIITPNSGPVLIFTRAFIDRYENVSPWSEAHYEIGWVHSWTPPSQPITHGISLFAPAANSPIIYQIPLSTKTITNRLDKDLGDFAEDETWSGFMGTVQVGKYGYCVTETSWEEKGPWLHKIDLETFKVVDSKDLSIDLSAYSINMGSGQNLCTDQDKLFLYVGGENWNTGAFVLIKIDIETFTVVLATETIGWLSWSGVYPLQDLFIGANTYHLYVYAAASTNPNNGHLIKFSTSTLLQESAVDYVALGYDELTRGHAFNYASSNVQELYIGARKIVDGTAYLLKIDVNTLSIDKALQVDLHSENLSYIKHISSNDLIVVSSGFKRDETNDGVSKPLVKIINWNSIVYNEFSTLYTLELSSLVDEQFEPKVGIIYLDHLYLLGAHSNDGGDYYYATLADIHLCSNQYADLTYSITNIIEPNPYFTTYYSQNMFLYCYHLMQTGRIGRRKIQLWITT